MRMPSLTRSDLKLLREITNRESSVPRDPRSIARLDARGLVIRTAVNAWQATPRGKEFLWIADAWSKSATDGRNAKPRAASTG